MIRTQEVSIDLDQLLSLMSVDISKTVIDHVTPRRVGRAYPNFKRVRLPIFDEAAATPHHTRLT